MNVDEYNARIVEAVQQLHALYRDADLRIELAETMGKGPHVVQAELRGLLELIAERDDTNCVILEVSTFGDTTYRAMEVAAQEILDGVPDDPRPLGRRSLLEILRMVAEAIRSGADPQRLLPTIDQLLIQGKG